MRFKDCVVARSVKVAWQEFEQKIVVVTPLTKKILVFNDMAAFIWKHLSCPKRGNELIGLICDEYDVDEVTAEKDAEGFIKELLVKEIVSVKMN